MPCIVLWCPCIKLAGDIQLILYCFLYLLLHIYCKLQLEFIWFLDKMMIDKLARLWSESSLPQRRCPVKNYFLFTPLKPAVLLSPVCVWSEMSPNVCQAWGRQNPSEQQSSTLFHCDQLLLGWRPKSVSNASSAQPCIYSKCVCVYLICSDPHWYPARQALMLDPSK